MNDVRAAMDAIRAIVRGAACSPALRRSPRTGCSPHLGAVGVGAAVVAAASRVTTPRRC